MEIAKASFHVIKGKKTNWEIEDRLSVVEREAEQALGLVSSATETAQRYHRVTKVQVEDLQSQLQTFGLAFDMQGRKIAELDRALSSARNTIIMVGAISAIVSSTIVSLLVSSSAPVVAPQVRTMQMRSGG